jgi:hypothetical protein
MSRRFDAKSITYEMKQDRSSLRTLTVHGMWMERVRLGPLFHSAAGQRVDFGVPRLGITYSIVEAAPVLATA